MGVGACEKALGSAAKLFDGVPEDCVDDDLQTGLKIVLTTIVSKYLSVAKFSSRGGINERTMGFLIPDMVWDMNESLLTLSRKG